MATIVKGYPATLEEPGVRDCVEDIDREDAREWIEGISREQQFDILSNWLRATPGIEDKFLDFVVCNHSGDIADAILGK